MISCPPPPETITPNSRPNHFFARGATFNACPGRGVVHVSIAAVDDDSSAGAAVRTVKRTMARDAALMPSAWGEAPERATNSLKGDAVPVRKRTTREPGVSTIRLTGLERSMALRNATTIDSMAISAAKKLNATPTFLRGIGAFVQPISAIDLSMPGRDRVSN